MNKKTIGLVLIVVIIVALVLTGCTDITEGENYIEENGFECTIYESTNDAALISLANVAFDAEELVLPKTVCGYNITHIFDWYLVSPHTKKMFVPDKNYVFNSHTVFSQFAALEKIILLSNNEKNYSYGFCKKGQANSYDYPYSYTHALLCVAKESLERFESAYYMDSFVPANISYYYNYELAENEENYWMGEAGSIEIMINEPVREGYELGGWYTDIEGKKEFDFFDSNNSPYMKIYPKWIVPNGGYCWIDDLNEGEKIKTKPADPTRENYNFGGWYTEAECLNAFDFDSFVKSTEDLELYAKWNEIL